MPLVAGERLSAMTDDMWETADYRAVAEKVTSIGDIIVRGGRASSRE
jgi:hypothetical protein